MAGPLAALLMSKGVEQAEKLSGGLMQRAGNWLGNKIFGNSENEAMRKQQEMLQKLQLEGNKVMLDQLADKERMMIRNSMADQVAGLENAGLSKSLMYGGSGAGGTTGGSAGAPSTAVAENPTDKLMASAQLELMSAQAEKTRAEANAISFDNDVRSNVGIEGYIGKAKSELEKERQANKIEYRKAINLIDALDEGDGDIIADAFGGYSSGSGWVNLGKQQADELKQNYEKVKAEINAINQGIESSKQGVKESISKEKLNEIDAKIADFKADLSGLGLNETTVKILELILKTFSGRRR